MAQTFNIRPGRQEGPKDSGPGFRWFVRICGLIAIGGFFLPYLSGSSGLDLINEISDGISKVGFSSAVGTLFEARTIPGSLVKFLFLFAFFGLPFVGLVMVLRGKYAGGPFTLLLLFNIAAFVMFRFFGADADLNTNFFLITGIGYWVTTGALFLPFVGMFFFDKSI